MPTQSRSNRANAKYNVITDFPHLGLHAAAASGDVGLVKYALSHGQPVNSVLGGVLPLHAASAGGDELIVKLLIQHGADVNAARLPLRYSDRNNRDAAGGPIVGTSGSTPLHFAAANGHTHIVRILLLNGARADLADKHGVTPQAVARENGWLECAETLKEWLEDKDRDLNALNQLTPSYGLDGNSGQGGGRRGSGDGLASRDKSPCRPEIRKRLHLKRSIDNALNSIKGTSTPPELFDKTTLSSPPPSASASTSSSAAPTPPGNIQSAPASRPDTLTGRRPSLQAERQTVSARYRRPKSAESGTDASPSPRKLGSKLSLLNLFKKSNIDGSSSSIALGLPPAPHNVERSPAPSASSSLPMVSSPPGLPHVPLSSSPRNNSVIDINANAREPIVRGIHPRSKSDSQGQVQAHSHDQSQDQIPTRSGSNSDAGSGGASQARPGILRIHHRSSSTSGQSQPQSHSSSSSHVQTQAQIQAQAQVPPYLSKASSSPRNIRFDSSSSSSSLAGRAQSPSASRQLSGTATSTVITATLTPPKESRSGTVSLSAQTQASLPQQSCKEEELKEDEDEEILRTARPPLTPPIVVAAAEDGDEDEYEDDEDEYGIPLDHSQSFLPQMPSTRGRATSAASSSSSSLLAPHQSNAANATPTMLACDSHTGASAFPFSISEPPPCEADDLIVPLSDGATLGPESALLSASIGRLRGESMSSASTDNSHHRPPRSMSSTTSGGASTTGLATPNTPHYVELPSPHGALAAKGLPPMTDSPRGEIVELSLPPVTGGGAGADTSGLAMRRGASAPMDIDLTKISTHAQAEALVQRTQANILMDFEDEDEQESLASSATSGPDHSRVGSGERGLMVRTPLSAKLLALGESLALERKLKEEEERKAAFDALGQGVKGREKERRGSHGEIGMRTARRVRKELTRSGSKEKVSYDALDIRRPSIRHMARAASQDEVFTSDSETDRRSYPRNTHRHPQPQLHPRSFSSHLHPHQHTQAPSSQSQPSSQPRSQRSQSHHRMYSHSQSTVPQPSPRGHRARTPDPDQNCPDFLGAPLSVGIPLSRCSTAPSHATPDSPLDSPGSVSGMASRRDNQQIRHMMSANKLTRMGFVADSLLGLPGSVSLSGSLGGGGVGGGGSSVKASGESKRFRPIRSIMQSLQGRS